METRVHVSPETLVAELGDLRGVDWPAVWKGPPPGGSPAFHEWCAVYGWEPLEVEADLEVRTRHGNSIYFRSRGRWRPVVSLGLSLFRVRTGIAEEKGAVVEASDSRWPVYVEAVSSVLGGFAGAGLAGEPGFPSPPVDGLWKVPTSPQDNPRRVAYWVAEGEQAPIVVLEQGVSLLTWQERWGAGSNVSLDLLHPREGR